MDMDNEDSGSYVPKEVGQSKSNRPWMLERIEPSSEARSLDDHIGIGDTDSLDIMNMERDTRSDSIDDERFGYIGKHHTESPDTRSLESATRSASFDEDVFGHIDTYSLDIGSVGNAMFSVSFDDDTEGQLEIDDNDEDSPDIESVQSATFSASSDVTQLEIDDTDSSDIKSVESATLSVSAEDNDGHLEIDAHVPDIEREESATFSASSDVTQLEINDTDSSDIKSVESATLSVLAEDNDGHLEIDAHAPDIEREESATFSVSWDDQIEKNGTDSPDTNSVKSAIRSASIDNEEMLDIDRSITIDIFSSTGEPPSLSSQDSSYLKPKASLRQDSAFFEIEIASAALLSGEQRRADIDILARAEVRYSLELPEAQVTSYRVKIEDFLDMGEDFSSDVAKRFLCNYREANLPPEVRVLIPEHTFIEDLLWHMLRPMAGQSPADNPLNNIMFFMHVHNPMKIKASPIISRIQYWARYSGYQLAMVSPDAHKADGVTHPFPVAVEALSFHPAYQPSRDLSLCHFYKFLGKKARHLYDAFFESTCIEAAKALLHPRKRNNVFDLVGIERGFFDSVIHFKKDWSEALRADQKAWEYETESHKLDAWITESDAKVIRDFLKDSRYKAEEKIDIASRYLTLLHQFGMRYQEQRHPEVNILDIGTEMVVQIRAAFYIANFIEDKDLQRESAFKDFKEEYSAYLEHGPTTRTEEDIAKLESLPWKKIESSDASEIQRFEKSLEEVYWTVSMGEHKTIKPKKSDSLLPHDALKRIKEKQLLNDFEMKSLLSLCVRSSDDGEENIFTKSMKRSFAAIVRVKTEDRLKREMYKYIADPDMLLMSTAFVTSSQTQSLYHPNIDTYSRPIAPERYCYSLEKKYSVDFKKESLCSALTPELKSTCAFLERFPPLAEGFFKESHLVFRNSISLARSPSPTWQDKQNIADELVMRTLAGASEVVLAQDKQAFSKGYCAAMPFVYKEIKPATMPPSEAARPEEKVAAVNALPKRFLKAVVVASDGESSLDDGKLPSKESAAPPYLPSGPKKAVPKGQAQPSSQVAASSAARQKVSNPPKDSSNDFCVVM